jgi:hypothetical protein
MPKKDVPLVRLERREWFFEDCPDEEILGCWRYQFAREVDWLRAAIDKRGAANRKTIGDGTYSFLIMPQWPSKPYLSVDKEEREKWIKHSRGGTDQELWAYFLVPDRLPGRMEGLEVMKDRGGIRTKSQRLEITLLRIDWGVPDTILRKCFDSYLKQFRPTVIQPKNHGAKKTPGFVRRQQLQQLGMFRIIRANGGSVPRAKKSEKHLQIEKIDPWYNARKVVSDIIENAETKIVPKLSREELEQM